MSTAAMILLERRAEAAEAESKLRLARMEYATDQHAKIMVENADLKARVAELEAALEEKIVDIVLTPRESQEMLDSWKGAARAGEVTIGELQARVEGLEAALRFYAIEANWVYGPSERGATLSIAHGPIRFEAPAGRSLPTALRDYGAIARAALQREPGDGFKPVGVEVFAGTNFEEPAERRARQSETAPGSE